MKIIFINRFFHPDQSATSQILSDLVFYLASQGMRVEVVASRQKYEDPKAVLPGFEIVNGVSIHRIWTTRFGRAGLFGRSFDYITFYIGAFLSLVKHLRKGDVVVAKTDPPLVSVVAMMGAKIRGAKLINWTQDIFPEVAVALRVKIVVMFSGLFQWARNLSFKSAAMNVAIGEKMANVIKAQGVEESRVCVIPNWSDGSQIKPINREENLLRHEWGIGDKFVVGYSGNIGRAHEFKTILGAASELSSESDILFLFIGDGKRRSAVQAYANEKGLKNIIFKPFQPYERLGQSLTAVDVHLISLRPDLEGFIVPSKIYGILASGRPVLNIGSGEGEVGREIQKIGCGHTVSVGDSHALSQMIRKFSRDSILAAEMGRKGREFFSKNFDRPLALKAWYDVLEKNA